LAQFDAENVSGALVVVVVSATLVVVGNSFDGE
jgi:hypothetical protein